MNKILVALYLTTLVSLTYLFVSILETNEMSEEILKSIINPDNNSTIFELSSKGFIKLNGTQFKENDKSYYIIGANYWQAMNLGASKSGNRSRVLKDLEILKNNGINCVRIMAGSEGPEGEPYRMHPALMNSPGDYNEDVFQGMK
jgi:mannan endo-1,4-beta-mannosidase